MGYNLQESLENMVHWVCQEILCIQENLTNLELSLVALKLPLDVITIFGGGLDTLIWQNYPFKVGWRLIFLQGTIREARSFDGEMKLNGPGVCLNCLKGRS